VLSTLARLSLNALSLLASPLWLLARVALRPRARWVHVRVQSRLVELERALPWFVSLVPALARSRPTSLAVLRELADFVVADPRIEGVLFELPPLSAGWASCQALREILLQLRGSGRKVVAYLPHGGGNRELYVASAADRVLASPHAQLAPLGLAASVTYFKGLLDAAGLAVEVHRRAEYKTAAEPATRDSMSDAQREQTEALLATYDRALREALAARPGVGPSGVDALFDEALIAADRAARDGILDGVCYEDELKARLTPEGKPVALVRAPRYFAWRRARLLRPLRREPFVAVIPVHGAIGMGEPTSRSGRKFAATVASIRAARSDPRVLGVVLHVDSPGGSALASDLIHREVERLRERKPVVACFGDVAASGGYYVSAGADAIVAQPLTVTGSIGVVSARLVTEPLLERLGVRVETVRKAPHADMFRRAGKLDPAEDAIVDREIDAFYRAFVGVVARGRRRSEEQLEPLARGRVWSGSDASDRGLVDRLGGLDAALAIVRERLAGTRSPRALARLRPRLLSVRSLAVPPAEPKGVDEVARLVLTRVDPALAELWELASGSERVLCYAHDLPRVG
jgi:protease-4